MCGITGIAALNGTLDPDVRRALPTMTRALEHRGPDGEGFFADDYVAVGHRRLAIIDRQGGSQPMSNEDGSCWIVFNGEIYNHRALRHELVARGHEFRTQSDTETILHAYEEYGPRCLNRLSGMFAFAVYDQRRRELFVARDRLGKKPLFYAILGGVFHFASEIKAFFASPQWNDEIDLAALEGYFSLGYVLAPGTIYRHVSKLEPAHWLRVRRGRVEVHKYWDIERFDDDRRSEPALLADLEEQLEQAVRDRLESEVPLGAFLSGGIDSGLVVSAMSEAIGANVQTTSVGFADAAHNELHAAGLTARHFNTQHRAEVVEPRLESVLYPIVAAFDEPFADSSAIPTFYVSQAARRHVTVALTGDGGDETFGGYDFRYVPHALEHHVRRFVPGSFGRRAVGTLGARWPRSPRLPRALRLGNVLGNLSRDAAWAYYADLCFFKPWETRRLLGLAGHDALESHVSEAVTAPYRRCPSSSPIQRAQYADLQIYLPNDPLVKVDRLSMLHGLEIRCPLLDHRLVEFAFRIPTRKKMPALRSKHLLRTLARRRLPAALVSLPKRGFTAPVGRWIAGPYADAFRAEVLGPKSPLASLLDMTHLKRLFDEHRARLADRSYVLWAAWTFTRWSEARRARIVARADSGDGWLPLQSSRKQRQG